jgi:hypothetical protein
MDELTRLAVAEAIKAEAGVIHHRILDPSRKDGYVIFGLAFPQRKIIHAPEGRTPKDLYLLAHECAHVALRHDHQKPRHVREYEAEMWAHAALPRHGVAIPEDSTAEAMLNVFFAIAMPMNAVSSAAVQSGSAPRRRNGRVGIFGLS